MTSAHPSQMTLNLEPALVDRFPTLRSYVAYRVQTNAKPAKVIAGDMDMAPSLLSRKLNPGEADTQRFNVDDLESYLKASGDAAAVIEYLAAKFMDTPEARQARAISKLEGMLPELSALLASVKGAG